MVSPHFTDQQNWSWDISVMSLKPTQLAPAASTPSFSPFESDSAEKGVGIKPSPGGKGGCFWNVKYFKLPRSFLQTPTYLCLEIARILFLNLGEYTPNLGMWARTVRGSREATLGVERKVVLLDMKRLMHVLNSCLYWQLSGGQGDWDRLSYRTVLNLSEVLLGSGCCRRLTLERKGVGMPL